MRFSVVVLAALAALSGGAQAAGNLVIDGSFSAGLANWQALYVDRSDSAFVYTYSGIDIRPGNVGCIGASCLAAGPFLNLTLSQSIATPAPGVYGLSFDIRSLSTFSPGNSFSASFGGVQLYRSADTEIGEWQHVSLLGRASGSHTPLSFDIVAPSGNYYLSNVALVSAVPEAHSYLMLLAGLVVVGWAVQRRRPG